MTEGTLESGQSRWWESEPSLDGNGLGLVLHQVYSHAWLVARVLMKSPAEAAGVQAGDRLLAVDAHTAAETDLERLSNYIRQGEVASHTLRLVRADGTRADPTVEPRPIRALIVEDAAVGRFGLGDGFGAYCYRCRPVCLNSTRGFAYCSEYPPQCSTPCGIA